MREVEVDFTTAGGNRHPSAADWAPGLLAFGAGNNVALWNPEASRCKGISTLLSGHTDTVNAVNIYDTKDQRLLISGGADKTIRVWKATDESCSRYQQTQILSEHQSSINAISVSPNDDLFVTGAADGLVKIWSLAEGEAKLLQTISLKPRYLPLATALTSLANGATVLAVAGTSTAVQLYVRAERRTDFELQATLTGHEGWIRSLDFVAESDEEYGDILLASASQDKYIRLWRFHKGAPATAIEHAHPIVALSKESLSNKTHQVGTAGSKYAVTFEALLIGHEDWIYTVRWSPKNESGSRPTLLSASADNSLSIWTADEASGLWVCNTRLGEISSQKGSTSATGSTGGFWIGLWSPEGGSVASLGRTGSWRRWCYEPASDSWFQAVGISGHTQEVQGLAWAPDGSYLLSTSSDQTTRMFAEWKREDGNSWHEFARPQIHGYDLNCVSALTPNQFISGADEKLLRVFDKPKAIDHLLSKLSGVQSTVAGELADAANIPVLGLSNKAVTAIADDEPGNGVGNGDAEERKAVDTSSFVHKSTLDIDHPPLEDQLARHTLWPEHEKLYGHGYEVSAVATNHDGSLVATACKASSIDHAVIRLYETKDWREVKPPLTAHSLTVTSLAFSPDDEHILSVGRDRQWAIFEREAVGSNSYKPLTTNPKGHSRMILGCSWAPNGVVFATAGRDRLVKLWRVGDQKAELVSTINAPAPVTAVAFELDTATTDLRLAYGTEKGDLFLAELSAASLQTNSTFVFQAQLLPAKAIHALQWRPTQHLVESTAGDMAERDAQLAAASEDSSIRIYTIPR